MDEVEPLFVYYVLNVLVVLLDENQLSVTKTGLVSKSEFLGNA